MNRPLDIPSLRILVIEDDMSMRRLIVKSLQVLGGKRILDVGNGAEGLDAVTAAAGRLDLIICDLEMPTMDGFEFIERLRKGADCQKSKDTPVVVLTGHSGEEHIQNVLSLGIQGFMVKPITLAALESKISSSIGAPTIAPGLLAPNKQ